MRWRRRREVLRPDLEEVQVVTANLVLQTKAQVQKVEVQLLQQSHQQVAVAVEMTILPILHQNLQEVLEAEAEAVQLHKIQQV